MGSPETFLERLLAGDIDVTIVLRLLIFLDDLDGEIEKVEGSRSGTE